MLIRPLFQKYQKQILAFANSPLGRWYLGIKDVGPIIRVTPDGIHILKDFVNDKAVIQAKFWSRSPLLKKFNLALTSMVLVEEGFDKFSFSQLRENTDLVIPQYLGLIHTRLLPRIYLTTTSFVPDANPETTSVDGHVLKFDAAGESLTNITSGNGTTATDDTATFKVCDLESFSDTDTYDLNARSFILFDTSSLTVNAAISSATLTVRITTNVSGSEFTGAAVGVILVNPASNTSLATTDYNSVTLTRQATDLLISGMSAGADSVWTLNATGLSNISLTSISKFGTTNNKDIDQSATWAYFRRDNMSCDAADNGSNKPTLAVTYTLFAPTTNYLKQYRRTRFPGSISGV